MKRNKKSLLVLSLTSFVCFGALTSCNGGGESEPTKTVEGTLGEPALKLSLDSKYIETKETTRNFSPQLVYSVAEDGTINYASSKSTALLTSGTSVHLFAWGVPEGDKVGVTVLDATGNEVSDFPITNDGTITAPSVNTSTDYQIMVYVYEETESTIKSIAKKAVNLTVVPTSEVASPSSYADYSSLNGDERTKMAAQIEKYMYNNGLAPITAMEYSGYCLYSDRISTPFLDQNLYVPGFGYGILTYGTITKAMEAEATEKWQMYYHDQLDVSYDEGNFNYLNSNSNSVYQFYSYISSGYFSTYVNEDNTSSEYQKGLSRLDAPVAIDPDENGASNKWKVYLRVGGDADNDNGVTKGLTYRTASSKFSSYDGRNIALEDYLTPFKLMATQSIGWYRGTEQAGEDTVNRQIKGFAEYYQNSGEATELPSDEEFCKEVGVSIDKEENSLTIEFNDKITPDYIEYQMDGLWANPICEDFVKELGNGDVIAGAKAMGTNSGSLTPLDTMLCVGPYYTEYYESKKTVCYKKNETWPLTKDNYNRDLYRIEGIHINLNSALASNSNTYIELFEAGSTDYSNIPSEYWDKYVNSPLRKKVDGDSLNQLFLNTWDEAFHASRFDNEYSNSWEVKPILSNNNFFKALSIGIDRQTMADYFHYSPAYEIQEPINKATPKSEVYNSTSEHKKAVSEAFNGIFDDDDYTSSWKDDSADYFELAIQEELDAGHYTLGTGSNPTEVTIALVSVDKSQAVNVWKRVSYVFESWKEAFELAVKSHTDENGNHNWVDENGNPLIVFNPTTEEVAYDSSLQANVIDRGVQAGKYDGETVYYISGNAYDVLNNMEKYKSDNSNGFTLNYGLDTSLPSKDIYYDGKYWSFDTLWNASNGGTFVTSEGRSQSETTLASAELDPTSKTISFTYLPDYVSNLKVYLDSYTEETGETYIEVSPSTSGGNVTVNVPDEAFIPLELFYGSSYAGYTYVEIDIEYDLTVNGVTTTKSDATYWMY